MRKLILFLMLLFILGLATNVMATAITVTANGPTNNTVETNPVTFNITVTGNHSTYSCTTYSDHSGTWQAIETDSSVSNNTATTFNSLTMTEAVGGSYNWNTKCTTTTNTTGGWFATTTSNTSNANNAYLLGVDDTDPSITVNNEADLYWDDDGLIILNLTVEDNNPNTCILISTMNSSSNATQTMTAETALAYSNDTWFNFTTFDGVEVGMADNNTGAYTWNVSCTDDAGNTATVATRTIYVDSVSPTAFTFNSSLYLTDNDVTWLNNTVCSDWTPELGWNATVDDNFVRYRVRLYNDSSCAGTTFSEANVTSRTTLMSVMPTLLQDEQYYASIIAYDEAGNTATVTGDCDTYYKTTPTNIGHNLLTGWNIVPQLGDALNASELLTQTGATTIAYFNDTHEFETYATGGTDFEVPAGEAFFSYNSDATETWSDLVINATAHGTISTIRNETATQWNLAIQLNSSDSFTFANLDYFLNKGNSSYGTKGDNYTYFVIYNNSAATTAKYVDFKSNWSFHSTRNIAYGDPIWILNNNVTNTSNSYGLDWSDVADGN